MPKTLQDNRHFEIVQYWKTHTEEGSRAFRIQVLAREFQKEKAPAEKFAVSISGNYFMDVGNEITVSQDEDMATEEKSDVHIETDIYINNYMIFV